MTDENNHIQQSKLFWSFVKKGYRKVTKTSNFKLHLKPTGKKKHKEKTHKYISPSFSFVQYMIILNNTAFKIFFLSVFIYIVLHIILDICVGDLWPILWLTERKEKKVPYLIKTRRKKLHSFNAFEKKYCYKITQAVLHVNNTAVS